VKLVSDDEIQAYTAAGWWGTRSCWDCFVDNASRAPAMLAVADPPDRANFTTGEPRRWTYADLRRAAEAMAASFAAAGLTRGDLVMVQLPNVVELVTVYLAAARIGAVVSPLAVQYRTHELRQMLPRVQPKVFITTTNAASSFRLRVLIVVLLLRDSSLFGGDGDHRSRWLAQTRARAPHLSKSPDMRCLVHRDGAQLHQCF